MLRFVVLAFALVSCGAAGSRQRRLSEPRMFAEHELPPGCAPVFPEVCEMNPLEISFVVDASSSIGKQNFARCLNFLEDFVSYFQISQDVVRVSMVTFAEGADGANAFGLTEYGDALSLKKAIANTPYTEFQWTNTSAGLWYFKDHHLGDKRANVRHIAIVITDGRSQETSKTRAASADVLAEDVEVFAIGVGSSVHYPELTTIAGDARHVFETDSYEALHTITERLIFQTCDVPTFPECELDPVELAFVMDSSASINEGNFNLTKEFVQSFADHFKIDQDHVRMATITFDVIENKEDAIQFDDYVDKRGLLTRLGDIKYHAGSYTNTGAGIHYMYTTLMSKARPNTAKVCIVLTDGNSQERQATKNQAKAARESGVLIYAVGVGAGVDQAELENIAGDPGRIIAVDNYNELNAFKETLLNVTCDGIVSRIGNQTVNYMQLYTTTAAP